MVSIQGGDPVGSERHFSSSRVTPSHFPAKMPCDWPIEGEGGGGENWHGPFTEHRGLGADRPTYLVVA